MDIGFLIDGDSVNAEDGGIFERKDPVTGKVATVAAAASLADVSRVALSSAKAFKTWSETGPGERRKLLLATADLLETKTPEFISLMLEEIGATAPWSGFNVAFAASVIREAAALTTQIKGEIIPADKPGTLSMAIRQPAGVVLSMAPWNAPIILAARAIAAPLACGNTVILRSSEICPATHMLLGKIFNDAGFPPGVVNVISNDPADAPEIVAELIAHPAIRRINFTGSSNVGKSIAKLAAAELKPVLLELGGKAPFIVLDDADIEGAVNAAAFGAFMNQGQICMSTERFIVDESIADEFVNKFAQKASNLPSGDPRGKVVLGSLVSEDSAIRMIELVEDAISKGAKLVAGGKRNGSIVEATLLDHITPEMRIYKEESFGPVKGIIRVKGDEEAIDIANDTEYGLSSSVYTKDTRRGMDIAKKLETGICHINGPTVGDEAQMPFGGTKSSGYGRFGGSAVINEFTELRWVTIEDPDQHYPF